MARLRELPEVAHAGALDGAVDVAGPGVVGGERQVPVAVPIVQVAQVACGRPRRLLGVESLVDVRIAAQPVELGRAAHELPEPERAGRGERVHLEGALDVREEDEILRDALFLEDPPRHREIAARALQARLEVLMDPAQEVVDPGEHAEIDDDRVVEQLLGWRQRSLGRGGEAVGDVRHLDRDIGRSVERIDEDRQGADQPVEVADRR